VHGSVLAQSGIDALQPGDSSTAKPTTPRRSNFGATTSNASASGVAVEETGTVKWFNIERGFGFIALNDGGKDVFVHISALERSGIEGLSDGQTVVVDVVEGRKGPEAAKVRLV
jgi:CspA family cold shock protein